MVENYTTDIVYPSSFDPLQAPIHMALIAGLRGRPHVFSPNGFAYADFGCGSGESLNILAACYPQATFVGVDVNQNHLEIARDVAARAGLTNVTYIEGDFNSLDPAQLPKLDYAAAIGVFSWLDSTTRQKLQALVAGSLKEEGLFLLHYSCFPGAAQVRMVSVLTNLFADRLDERSDYKATASLDYVASLLEGAAGFKTANPTALQLVETLQALDPRYSAHDILNSTKDEIWFHDVVQGCQDNGLEFVASADPRRIVLEELAPPEMASSLKRIAEQFDDQILREEAQNFLLNEPFRYDLFTRNTGSRDTSDATGQAFRGLYCFGVLQSQFQNVLQRFQTNVSVDLSNPIYQSILTLAADGPVEIGQLFSRLEASQKNEEVRRALANLFGLRLLIVCTGERENKAPDVEPSPSALDLYVLDEFLADPREAAFPSTFLGNGVMLSRMDRIVLAGIVMDDTAAVWDLLKEKNVNLKIGANDTVTSLEQFRQLLAAGTAQFKQTKLPELLRRGLMAPA